MNDFRIIEGDVVAKLQELPAESVHACVTSPPYWGLRDYGYPGQIGLEATPAEYLERMVGVFRHVRRAMHSSGSLWLNMGDSYVSNPHGNSPSFDPKYAGGRNRSEGDGCNRSGQTGLKSKDMVMMPARLALALQADGWYLRSQIPWLKRNGMPESTTDRPTGAVEYIFLLSKSEEYFYDREGVRLAASTNSHARGNGVNPKAMGPNSRIRSDKDPAHQTEAKIRNKQNRSFSAAVTSVVSTRARRNSDWFFTSAESFNEKFQGLMVDGAGDPLAMVVNPQPFSLEMCGACEVIYPQLEYRRLELDEKDRRICTCGKVAWVSHFATFPERMVTPCILAGTSEHGCCHHCGAPYERIVERPKVGDWHPDANRGGNRTVPATCGMRAASSKHARGAVNRMQTKCAPNGDQFSSSRMAANREAAREATGRHDDYFEAPQTLGWRPTCSHPLFPSERVPCVVLDPFSGSGRTGLAAVKLGRGYVGIEGNPQYVKMSAWQFDQVKGIPA